MNKRISGSLVVVLLVVTLMSGCNLFEKDIDIPKNVTNFCTLVHNLTDEVVIKNNSIMGTSTYKSMVTVKNFPRQYDGNYKLYYNYQNWSVITISNIEDCQKLCTNQSICYTYETKCGFPYCKTKDECRKLVNVNLESCDVGYCNLHIDYLDYDIPLPGGDHEFVFEYDSIKQKDIVREVCQ